MNSFFELFQFKKFGQGIKTISYRTVQLIIFMIFLRELGYNRVERILISKHIPSEAKAKLLKIGKYSLSVNIKDYTARVIVRKLISMALEKKLMKNELYGKNGHILRNIIMKGRR